jgi:hypothetical protein
MRVPLVEITARMPWVTVNDTSSGRSGRIRGSPPENNTTGTPKSFRSASRARPSDRLSSSGAAPAVALA